ncbi:MAG: hypothetical protein LBF01_02705, partial [Bacteroidales bacterium]|nr:hypothetical protein [Bacteroidales bacterium]
DTNIPTRVVDTNIPTRVVDVNTPTRVVDVKTPARVVDTNIPTRVVDTNIPARVVDMNIPARVANTDDSPTGSIHTRVIDADIPTRTVDTDIPTRVTGAAQKQQEFSNTLSAVVEDRMRRMRELKEKMQSSTGIEHIAAEPAYILNGAKINVEVRHSTASTAYATKTTEDGRITENGFFNNNID